MIKPSNTEQDALLEAFKGSEEQLKQAEDLFKPQDMVKLIKFYTEENLPKSLDNTKFKDKFWSVLGKSPILTFLDAEDEDFYDSTLRIAKLQFLMMYPAYKYSFDDQMELNQIRMYFKSAIKRAIGFDKNKINERTMEATSINQIVRSNTEGFSGMGKPGFLGKLKNMM